MQKWLAALIVALSLPAFGLDLSSLSWLQPGGTAEPVTLSGKPHAVLQFWASWCSGCSENMTALEKIAGDDLGFFPVSIDETKAASLNYFRVKNKVPYSLFDEAMAFSESFKVPSLPYLVVIDAAGEVVFAHEGQVSKNTLTEIISKSKTQGKGEK